MHERLIESQFIAFYHIANLCNKNYAENITHEIK